MDDNLITVFKNELRVGTNDLYKLYGYNEHRKLKSVISQNKNEFLQLGFLPLQRQKPSKFSNDGRPSEQYLLNEDQFILLSVLVKNSKEAVQVKLRIVKQFIKMRDYIRTHANMVNSDEYKNVRLDSKQSRKEETDVIKQFVKYAADNGSSNSEKYYTNISRMVNTELFNAAKNLKPFKDYLSIRQLSTVMCAEQIVTNAIKEGMNRNIKYKDIYQMAKANVIKFVELYGKSDVPYIPNLIEST